MRTFPDCPLCGSTARGPYVSFDAVEFVACEACSVVYKSRERADLLSADFYEQGYFRGRKSNRDRRFAHRARRASSWLSDALECLPARDTSPRLLDVGCSLGYVLEGGKRLGMTSAGVDVSAYAVKVCNERGYEARVGTVDALPYDAGSFDVAMLKHVLEHTPKPKQALAELSRVLASDGVALIAVPDVRYWKHRWLRRSSRFYRPDDLGAQHHVYYSLATLSRLLEEAGFRVRFGSKAVYRRRQAARSLLHAVYERARFAVLWGWVTAARAFRLQREVYLLAAKR